tara:strand:- start:30486 stop:31328 length:843 start_codon:yes stop_codon:yes gene_type:complete
MRAVIFGGTGLLGSSILDDLQKKGCQCFISSQKKKSDFKSNLQSEKKILKFLKKINPNIIINCSGETNVDLCNESFKTAFSSNVLTVRNIVSAIKKTKKKIYFMHISTDHVYNNKKASNEENVKISNYYGASKYLGEIEAQKLKNSVILRTNFYGKSKANKRLSYSDYLIYNLSKKKNINIPVNVYFNPIHIDYLNQIILKLILFKINGVFNIGSKDVISKYNFAKKVAMKYKLNLKYLKSFKSIYSIHQRPLSTFMSTKKLKDKLKIKIPTIQSGINLL